MKHLQRLSEKDLLDTRLCDLNLKIEGSLVHICLKKVLKELSKKGIKVIPHFWISDEWFSPDGVPGVAVPFYLLHPRLIKLEKKMMGSVEGGTQVAATKIIRHEFAHVLDNGFRLRNNKIRQNLFGLTSEPYPDFYYPVKDTTKYVHHLDDWYAQAHPDEDWAESFAVWLSNPNWKKDFKTWECLPKIQHLDEVMKKIAGQKQKVSNNYILDPINESTQTLREYYLKKKKRFRVQPEKTNPYVVKYLKKYKRDIYKKLVEKTNQNTYNIKQIYKTILSDSDGVKLNGKVTRKKVIGLLTRQGVKYFRKRRIRIIM